LTVAVAQKLGRVCQYDVKDVWFQVCHTGRTNLAAATHFQVTNEQPAMAL
jgi:hypothetical protein